MDNIRFSPIEWQNYAEAYDALLHLSPYRALLRHIATAIQESGSRSILDAACGTGNLARFLSRSGGEPIRLIGIDRSSAMLDRAFKKYQIGDSAVISTSLDDRLPFGCQTFDCVASINTLYAVRSPKRTLEEFHRVLKTGRPLLLTTFKEGHENGLILKDHCGSRKPDTYWSGLHDDPEREKQLIQEALPDPKLREDMLLIARFNRLINQDRNFHFFREDSLISLLKETGFSIARISSVYSDQCFLIIAHS